MQMVTGPNPTAITSLSITLTMLPKCNSQNLVSSHNTFDTRSYMGLWKQKANSATTRVRQLEAEVADSPRRPAQRQSHAPDR